LISWLSSMNSSTASCSNGSQDTCRVAEGGGRPSRRVARRHGSLRHHNWPAARLPARIRAVALVEGGYGLALAGCTNEWERSSKERQSSPLTRSTMTTRRSLATASLNSWRSGGRPPSWSWAGLRRPSMSSTTQSSPFRSSTIAIVATISAGWNRICVMGCLRTGEVTQKVATLEQPAGRDGIPADPGL
jgi:hypothetical protein